MLVVGLVCSLAFALIAGYAVEKKEYIIASYFSWASALCLILTLGN